MSIPDYAAKEHVSPYTEERKDGLDSLDDRFHETAQFSFPGLSGMIRILEALV
jgi:hypothetical protein